MTQRIYENDSYCTEFTATVVDCLSDNGTYQIVLDRTAFFPEGGGQAADEGTLDSIQVLDVQRKGDTVLHKTHQPFEKGAVVTGKIDWDLRFSRMQAHAGEHIVSGVVNSLYGYSNVGFHMGEPLITVDFSGALSNEDIKKVELLSNRAVYSNAKITASYPSAAELKKLDYRSKIETGEDTRIVTIENIDCCACCAPHPARTGEIGLIKIINHYPHRQGTRIEMLAGICALADYSSLNSTNKAIMKILAAQRSGIDEAVRRLSESAQALRSENQRLLKTLALAQLKPIQIKGSTYSLSEGLSFDELRYCANSLCEQGFNFCILLSRCADGWCYVVSSKENQVNSIVSALNTAFGGKGGGKDGYAQGKLSAASEKDIISFVENLLNQ